MSLLVNPTVPVVATELALTILVIIAMCFVMSWVIITFWPLLIAAIAAQATGGRNRDEIIALGLLGQVIWWFVLWLWRGK